MKRSELPVIGWREWVALPHLGIDAIKVKVDTGARSSSLHAIDIEEFRRDGKEMVRFQVHPKQRDYRYVVSAEEEVIEWRRVKSSGGHVTRRPVILTPVRLGAQEWSIELTLVGRDEMGFRMLLGRQAVRGRFAVDPGRSYVIGRDPAKAKRKRKKKNKKQPRK